MRKSFLMVLAICFYLFFTTSAKADSVNCKPCQKVSKSVRCVVHAPVWVAKPVVRCTKKVVIRCCKPVKCVVRKQPVRTFLRDVGNAVTYPFRGCGCVHNTYHNHTHFHSKYPVRHHYYHFH